MSGDVLRQIKTVLLMFQTFILLQDKVLGQMSCVHEY